MRIVFLLFVSLILSSRIYTSSALRVPITDGMINVTVSADGMDDFEIRMVLAGNSASLISSSFHFGRRGVDVGDFRFSFSDQLREITALSPAVRGTDGGSYMGIGPMSEIVGYLGDVAILKNTQGPFELIIGHDRSGFVSSCNAGSSFSVRLVTGGNYCGGQVRLNGTVTLDREALIRVSTVPNSGLFLAPASFLEYVNNTLTANGSGGVERVPGSLTFIVANCTDRMIESLMPIDFLLRSINEFNYSGLIRYYPEAYISVGTDGNCKLNFGVAAQNEALNIDPIHIPLTNVRITCTTVEFCYSSIL